MVDSRREVNEFFQLFFIGGIMVIELSDHIELLPDCTKDRHVIIKIGTKRYNIINYGNRMLITKIDKKSPINVEPISKSQISIK